MSRGVRDDIEKMRAREKVATEGRAEVSDRKRCVHCGQFMAQRCDAPGGYACSLMVYAHAFRVWEHL